jgi:hypothetical protein
LPANWVLSTDRVGDLFLNRPGGKVRIAPVGTRRHLARVFKDEAGKDRLIVAHSGGYSFSIIDPDTGKAIAKAEVLAAIHDLAVSPDEKYLLVAGDDLALHICALTRPPSPAPLLSILAREERDWIVFAPQKGYYAATPRGEELAGWKVATAEDRLAVFYTAGRFRKALYRPDLIREVLKAGSLQAALSRLKVRALSVDEMLPPEVRIRVKQDEKDRSKVTVEATAWSAVKAQPIQSLRLLIDGRPVLQARSFDKGVETATATWPVRVEEGKHELRVLARCPDVSGVSAPCEVAVPEADEE